MESIKNSRNQLVDFMRIILALMVVAIHLNVFVNYPDINNYTVDGFFRVAVPFFFIVNGYYFKHSIKNIQSFKKWIIRVLILFISWQLIYLPTYLPVGDFSLQHLAVFLSEVIFGYYHLWYLSAMLMGGICLYIFRAYRYALIFCFLLFTIGWLLQYLRVFIPIESVFFKVMSQYWIFRNGFFYGFPMMYIGFYLSERNLIDKLSVKVVSVFFVFSFLLLFFEVFITRSFFFAKISYHVDFFLSLMLFAPSLFLLSMKIGLFNSSGVNTKNLALLGGAIYFIHPYMIVLANSIDLRNMLATYLVVISLTLLFSFILLAFKKRLSFLL